MAETTYGIGELAREFKLSLRALRFYEEKKLLKPMRSGMWRIYSEGDRERIGNIVRWRKAGLDVVEIGLMLEQLDDGFVTSVRSYVLDRLDGIERDIRAQLAAIDELRAAA